jgi:hypothetical protein
MTSQNAAQAAAVQNEDIIAIISFNFIKNTYKAVDTKISSDYRSSHCSKLTGPIRLFLSKILLKTMRSMSTLLLIQS